MFLPFMKFQKSNKDSSTVVAGANTLPDLMSIPGQKRILIFHAGFGGKGLEGNLTSIYRFLKGNRFDTHYLISSKRAAGILTSSRTQMFITWELRSSGRMSIPWQ